MIKIKIKNIIKYFYLKGIEFVSLLANLFIRKIDRELLIFGGNTFTGNTKHLFLYLNNKFKDQYKIVWISGNKDLVNKLESLKYKAQFKLSVKSFFLLIKARAIFVTHGFNDILPITPNKKTILVYLAHGIPFKRPNFDAKNFQTIFTTRYDLDLITKLFKRMDYHISCSDNFNKILARAYKMPVEKVITTGYPRNDIFYNRDKNKLYDLKDKFAIPREKKVILYAPTFREHRTIKFPIAKEEITLLEDLLNKLNITLVIKPHISEKFIEFEEIKNCKTISSDIDIQELLLISDALITDYSSVFLDYILTERPIIFFAYDLEYFRKTRGNFYYKYEDFIPGPLVSNGMQLIKQLRTVFDNQYLDKIKKIKDFSHKYQDGNSSQRICELLEI